jgi:hypothetical protein
LLDTGYWKLDTGYWKLDTGYWKLDTGSWILEAGCWLQRIRPGIVVIGDLDFLYYNYYNGRERFLSL